MPVRISRHISALFLQLVSHGEPVSYPVALHQEAVRIPAVLASNGQTEDAGLECQRLHDFSSVAIILDVNIQ